jgi:hypothetical protein
MQSVTKYKECFKHHNITDDKADNKAEGPLNPQMDVAIKLLNAPTWWLRILCKDRKLTLSETPPAHILLTEILVKDFGLLPRRPAVSEVTVMTYHRGCRRDLYAHCKARYGTAIQDGSAGEILLAAMDYLAKAWKSTAETEPKTPTTILGQYSFTHVCSPATLRKRPTITSASL